MKTELPSLRSQIVPLLFLVGIFFLNFLSRIILSPLMPTVEKDVAIEFQNSVQRAGGNMKANLAAGIALDPHSAKLNERTTALMAENSSVTFEEAAGQARTELGEGGRKFVIAVDPHSVKLLERVNVLRQRNSDLTFEEAASQARKEFGDKAPGV